MIGANAFERTEDKIKPARDYQKEHGYTFLFTTNNDELAKAWGVKGIPTMVIIGRDGVVEKVQVGFGAGTEVTLDTLVKGLLATNK